MGLLANAADFNAILGVFDRRSCGGGRLTCRPHNGFCSALVTGLRVKIFNTKIEMIFSPWGRG